MNREFDIFSILYKKIPQNLRLCFASGVGFGLLTHLYMLTNKLPNWDDPANMHGFGSGKEYGRWLLEYLYTLFGRWSIPAVNGVLAIVFLALAACFLYKALALKTKTSAVLVPLLMVTFPSVASMMTYMFTVHLYAIGICMCCMGAYCYRKGKWGFLPAIALFVLTCGVYQSYICLAAGILIFALLLDLLAGDSLKAVLRNGIKSALTLVVSLVAYMGVTNLFATWLTNDRGISTMGQVELLRLPRLIARSYKRILEYFVIEPYSFTTPFMHFMNITVVLLAFVLVFWLVKEKKIEKELPKMALLLFLGMLLPLALAGIYILAPETQDATTLMLFQYFFVYVVVVALAERCLDLDYGANTKASAKASTKACTGAGLLRAKFGKLCGVVSLVVVILISYNQFRLTNEAYFRMDIAYERVYAYYNRIAMRIESEPGYQYGDQIVLLGDFYPNPTPLSSYGIDDAKFVEMEGIAMENGLMTSGLRSNFMRIYLGIPIEPMDWDSMEALKETPEYKAMPEYPAGDSIQKIEDIWVVKIHEDDWKKDKVEENSK